MSLESLRATVCTKYGIADRELVDVIESPAGITFETSDGLRYIDVAADSPDAEGKTGLMYLAAPEVERGYQGEFPIFVNPDEDDESVGGDDGAVDLSTLKLAELVAHAKAAFGAELSVRSKADAVAAINELQAAADAATAENAGEAT